MPTLPFPAALALLEADPLRLRHGTRRTGTTVYSGPVSDDPNGRYSYSVRAAEDVSGWIALRFTAATRGNVSSFVRLLVLVDPAAPQEATYYREWTSGTDTVYLEVAREERTALDAWMARQDLEIAGLRWTLHGPRKMACVVGAADAQVSA